MYLHCWSLFFNPLSLLLKPKSYSSAYKKQIIAGCLVKCVWCHDQSSHGCTQSWNQTILRMGELKIIIVKDNMLSRCMATCKFCVLVCWWLFFILVICSLTDCCLDSRLEKVYVPFRREHFTHDELKNRKEELSFFQ